MSPEKDCLDVGLDIVVELDGRKDVISIALVDAVANGKLFLQNNDGSYTVVELAMYWKDNALLTVCRQGHEIDEDGNTTRDWRDEAVQS